MAVCKMCGKRFDVDDMEDYIGEKLGYDVLSEIESDFESICDSCALSVYYADHEDSDPDPEGIGTATWDEYTHIKAYDD